MLQNVLPFILYLLAGIAYAVHFTRRQPMVGQVATTLLLGAALVHTFAIGMQTMEVRHVPFANPSRAISTFVWLLALSYLYLEMTSEERSMGVFILPIAIALQLIPTIDPGIEHRDPLLDSPWFWVHTSSILFAYASFALAGVLGLTYVLQFKEIKKKQLGFFYTRLPSLQILDVMNSRAVTVGWVFLTLGLVVGFVWATQAQAAAPDNPRLQAFSFADPKILVTVLAWGVYSFAVVARRAMGWHGRKAAWLSATGFAIVLLNFLPINYFVTTSHSFGN
jgi:ABC-type transport system involved in cytochrome c biogenesis permease subunit